MLTGMQVMLVLCAQLQIININPFTAASASPGFVPTMIMHLCSTITIRLHAVTDIYALE